LIFFFVSSLLFKSLNCFISFSFSLFLFFNSFI
jgi:hypothetical protein